MPSAFSPAFHLFTKLGKNTQPDKFSLECGSTSQCDIFIGFGVLIAHFHGSSGVGQKYIDSLPGNIGTLDVEDCYASLQTALKKFPWLDPNRVVLFGGSHGGYLVTHLSSQYPVLNISKIHAVEKIKISWGKLIRNTFSVSLYSCGGYKSGC